MGRPFLNGQALRKDSLDLKGGLSSRSWERSVPGFWLGTFLDMGFSLTRRKLLRVWLNCP
jgi:hypothetical protein